MDPQHPVQGENTAITMGEDAPVIWGLFFFCFFFFFFHVEETNDSYDHLFVSFNQLIQHVTFANIASGHFQKKFGLAPHDFACLLNNDFLDKSFTAGYDSIFSVEKLKRDGFAPGECGAARVGKTWLNPPLSPTPLGEEETNDGNLRSSAVN